MTDEFDPNEMESGECSWAELMAHIEETGEVQNTAPDVPNGEFNWEIKSCKLRHPKWGGTEINIQLVVTDGKYKGGVKWFKLPIRNKNETVQRIACSQWKSILTVTEAQPMSPEEMEGHKIRLRFKTITSGEHTNDRIAKISKYDPDAKDGVAPEPPKTQRPLGPPQTESAPPAQGNGNPWAS